MTRTVHVERLTPYGDWLVSWSGTYADARYWLREAWESPAPTRYRLRTVYRGAELLAEADDLVCAAMLHGRYPSQVSLRQLAAYVSRGAVQ